MSKIKPKTVRFSHISLASQMARENENLTLTPYHDTVGKLTIGYGRNLEDRGLTIAESELLLANDITEAHNELHAQFGFYKDLSEIRQSVLIDLYHNMGISRLLGFKKMLKAIQLGNFDDAAKELRYTKYVNPKNNEEEVRNTEYWKQVGSRAKRNYCMLKFDKLYTKQEAESYFINQ